MELSIDVETYSEYPIKFGAQRYVEDKTFEILLFAYSFDDEPVEVIDMTKDPLPERVVDALYNKEITKTAFNAGFEMLCLKKYFPDADYTNWECTSVLALYCSLPASLDNVSKALRLGEAKDSRGKRLIQFFSVPRKPTKRNPKTRNMPEDAPDKWAEYIEYNRQDVVVEKAIRKRLLSLKPPAIEHEYWLLDQDINWRGVKVDMELVDAALACNDEIVEEATESSKLLTGLENPNSTMQLKEWLTARLGYDIETMRKDDVSNLLAQDIPSDVRKVLQNRQVLGNSSIKKYLAMKNAVCSDGRIHGMLQFYGAMRSGRWAGRVVQLQNLPRNYLEDLDTAREVLKSRDVEMLDLLYGNPGDVIKQLIRTALVAEEGHRFIVADFSAIEARVIAWLAHEQWRQDVFAQGGDIYCASASSMFHVPVVKHGENGHLRQKGKVAELALGYGGGVGAMKAMDSSGSIPEDELPGIIESWRKASPRIVRFWKDADSAAKKVVKTGEPVRIRQGNIKFFKAKGFMFIELPSGRRLAYARPRLGLNRFGSESIEYDGMDQVKNTWGRVETYGGKLVENIVQAVARDCLAAAMLRLSQAGYNIVAHIHDEVVIEAPIGEGSLEEVIDIMCEPEPWNEGLILNAAGFENPYYMKDQENDYDY